MITYKSFQFPKDTWLFAAVPLQLLRFLVMSKRHPAREVVGLIRSEKRITRRRGWQDLEDLKKCRRIIDYLLVGRLHIQRPCLLRSYVLLGESLARGIPASLCIAVKHDGDSLAGHSWIEIDGEAFMENPLQIAEYTLMTKE
jgi:hypothetical protein